MIPRVLTSRGTNRCRLQWNKATRKNPGLGGLCCSPICSNLYARRGMKKIASFKWSWKSSLNCVFSFKCIYILFAQFWGEMHVLFWINMPFLYHGISYFKIPFTCYLNKIPDLSALKISNILYANICYVIVSLIQKSKVY